VELNPVTWRPAARSVSPPQACTANTSFPTHGGGAPTARTCAVHWTGCEMDLGAACTALLAEASAEHA
jgi:hypothetical protein